MKCLNRWLALGLIVAVVPFCGCQKEKEAKAEAEHPATVDHIDGSEISRVTLSEGAMKRLDIQTAAVTEEKSPRGDAPQMAVQYAALIYDPKGNTWVYTSPEPRVFVREPIEVDFIQDGLAFLANGPKVGTNVAVVGVSELYGTEFTVGH
jgi:hypothetical protein